MPRRTSRKTSNAPPPASSTAKRSDPHDRLFKSALGQLDNARDFLRAVLPADVLRTLDLRRLVTRPTERIDDELGLRRPDLVYQAPLASRTAIISILLEHQSTTDPLMALRLLVAKSTLWLEMLRDDPKATRIPLLISVVVAHAAGGFRASTRFADLYDATHDERRGLERYLPDFEFLLEDLSAQTDAGLAARLREVYLQAALLSLKRRGTAPAPEDRALFEQIFRELAERGNLGAIRTLVRYSVSVAPRGVSSMVEVIKNAHPAYEKAYLTHYEHALQEGMQKGIEKGIEKGRAEGIEKGIEKGRLEGEIALLEKQLAKKFGPLSTTTQKRLRKGTHAELDRWAERVLTAKKLSEVFAKGR